MKMAVVIRMMRNAVSIGSRMFVIVLVVVETEDGAGAVVRGFGVGDAQHEGGGRYEGFRDAVESREEVTDTGGQGVGDVPGAGHGGERMAMGGGDVPGLAGGVVQGKGEGTRASTAGSAAGDVVFVDGNDGAVVPAQGRGGGEPCEKGVPGGAVGGVQVDGAARGEDGVRRKKGADVVELACREVGGVDSEHDGFREGTVAPATIRGGRGLRGSSETPDDPAGSPRTCLLLLGVARGGRDREEVGGSGLMA